MRSDSEEKAVKKKRIEVEFVIVACVGVGVGLFIAHYTGDSSLGCMGPLGFASNVVTVICAIRRTG